jgi:hypothetical protein
MIRLENWLYRYVSMYAHYLLHQALAAMVPSLVYRPVLQRVSPPRRLASSDSDVII